MKQTVIVTSKELMALAAESVIFRPPFRKLFVGCAELISDQEEKDPLRRIRCEVVLFESQATADEYRKQNEKPGNLDVEAANE